MGKDFSVISGKDGIAKVPDIKFFGDPDTWKLISKTWSRDQGWMKSTKALEVKGVGCFLQVTTQQKNTRNNSSAVAEAVTFAPGVQIVDGKLIDSTIRQVKEPVAKKESTKFAKQPKTA